MKTKPVFLVLFAAAINVMQAQEPEKDLAIDEERMSILYDQPQVDERTYRDSTGFYVIRFTYGLFDAYTPVGGEEGEVRYSAYVEVFRIEDCIQSIVGQGFMGVYSPNGCIYDEADYLIKEARKIELRAERGRN